MATQTDDLQKVPKMLHNRWAEQSAAVWYEVEREMMRGWPFACRETISQVAGPHNDPGRPGWLSVSRGRFAEKANVPVGRLFTACSQRQGH